MRRTKSSLWNIWVQTAVSPHSGQKSTENFLEVQQHPVQNNSHSNQRRSLPPTPCPSCTWQDTQKRSPRKSSGLKTNTIIFEFAQKGLFLPEAEGESWGQNVRTETALAYFSCQPADPWLQSCSENHGVGSRVSIKINRPWMIALVRTFSDFLSGTWNLHTNSIVICSLSVASPNHLQHPSPPPITAWLKPTYLAHKPYSLSFVKFPPPTKDSFTTKVCESQNFFIPGR